ncbi:hypothetical protein T484DRAFT_2019991 [Baffinella frigidus]|nr:hypothetical protein T484DRAFT_2019991 [Cryptophyta sp. CCMP2293]
MATTSLFLFLLLAFSLVAPGDALWFGAPGDVKPLRSPARPGDAKPLRGLAFQHINSRDCSLQTASSCDTRDPLDTVLNTIFVGLSLLYATGLSFLCLTILAPGFGFDFGLGPLIFTNAAKRGDVWTLRLMVHAGQAVDVKAWKGRTALMRATLAIKPAAIRFLLEEGAKTSADGKELEIVKHLLAERTAERSLKGLSWQERVPPHLDSKMKRLSECVELLQYPAKPAQDVKARKAAREILKNPPKVEDSSAVLQKLPLPKADDSLAVPLPKADDSLAARGWLPKSFPW